MMWCLGIIFFGGAYINDKKLQFEKHLKEEEKTENTRIKGRILLLSFDVLSKKY